MTNSLILERATSIAALPDFAMLEWWLTFYVAGDPDHLAIMGTSLSDRGGINTQGADSGFIYPKQKVANDPAAVAQLVAQVQHLATQIGVKLVAVDVDTSPEVGAGVFKELISFERGARSPLAAANARPFDFRST
jgi:hypothetical protein